ALATGARIAAVAHGEPNHRYERDLVQAVAKKSGGGYVLSGAKAVVFGAGAADTLLVSARGEAGDGLSVFAVPRTAEGVRVREYRLIDQRMAGDVTLEGVKLTADALLGPEGGARGALT